MRRISFRALKSSEREQGRQPQASRAGRKEEEEHAAACACVHWCTDLASFRRRRPTERNRETCCGNAAKHTHTTQQTSKTVRKHAVSIQSGQGNKKRKNNIGWLSYLSFLIKRHPSRSPSRCISLSRQQKKGQSTCESPLGSERLSGRLFPLSQQEKQRACKRGANADHNVQHKNNDSSGHTQGKRGRREKQNTSARNNATHLLLGVDRPCLIGRPESLRRLTPCKEKSEVSVRQLSILAFKPQKAPILVTRTMVLRHLAIESMEERERQRRSGGS